MVSKEQLLDTVYQLAYKYEAENGSCPQAVLSAIMETLDIGDEKIIQAADALAGGGALSAKGTCGALSGGLLALGCILGRPYAEFKQGNRKRLVFAYGKQLFDRFVKEYGSPLCCDVQCKMFGKSFCLSNREEYAAFEKAGAHVDKCPSVSGNAARWAVEIILNQLSDRLSINK